MSGVEQSGFVIKTEDEIFDELGVEGRARISPTLDTSPDSVYGQIAGILASKVAENWEVLEGVWGALSVNATGAQADRIAALTNTRRKNGESDVALRLRRRIELSDQGATTQSAIRAAISKLDGVQGVRVVSNRRMVIDAAGRPPKSVEAVTLLAAGADAPAVGATIAQVIWENLAAGIETHGTTTSSVTDSEGHAQTIKYSLAQPADRWVRIEFLADRASYPGDDAFKARITDFTSGALSIATADGTVIAGGVDIGAPLYASRIAAAALSVPGVINVTQVAFRSLEADAWAPGDAALEPREYLGLDGVRGFRAEHIVLDRQDAWAT